MCMHCWTLESFRILYGAILTACSRLICCHELYIRASTCWTCKSAVHIMLFLLDYTRLQIVSLELNLDQTLSFKCFSCFFFHQDESLPARGGWINCNARWAKEGNKAHLQRKRWGAWQGNLNSMGQTQLLYVLRYFFWCKIWSVMCR